MRAALRYFDEEFYPHGADAIADYLPGEQVTPEEVRELRMEMNEAQVRYVAPESWQMQAGAGRVGVLVMPSEAR